LSDLSNAQPRGLVLERVAMIALGVNLATETQN
jgi:hypothetical protein